MPESPEERDLVKTARLSGHRLAGIIGSISIGLHCLKLAGDSSSAQVVSDMEQAARQAQEELDKLRSILRELDSDQTDLS
jgi:hypothetical protein